MDKIMNKTVIADVFMAGLACIYMLILVTGLSA